MQFNCGLSFQEKQKWHKWFAWYPVRVGKGDCRWLEYVERVYRHSPEIRSNQPSVWAEYKPLERD